MKTQKNTESRARPGTVVGLFTDQPRAEQAIRDLKDAGFSDSQIGILMKDRDEQRRMAEETGSKAGEGAAAGAIGGGLVGGVLGLLAGVGALAIPGVGPLIAGGALASTLAGAGIGAAAGGLIGALVGMGIPEEEARYYAEGVREGGILVTVNAGNRAAEAREILRAAGADFGRGVTTATPAMRTEQERLELREEELRTSTEQVEAGEVRVRKDVVSEDRSIDVPVTREEVVIERTPVAGREAARGDIGEGEEIRIPVREEQVRVEKTPVVKEEITVGKRQVQDTERVHGTVRREEARVEESGDATVRNRGTATPWRGKERRVRRDRSYNGPERRQAVI